MSITRSSPVQVAAYSTTFSQAPKLVSTSWSKISVGPSHVLAIRSNNTLYAWGFNNVGQLGDGTTISRSSPVQIGNPSIYTWTDIVAGLNFSVGLRGDNLLFTWGLNTNGQLGDLNAGTSNRSSPIQVGTSSWNAVSAGGSHVVAIRSDKSLWAWGLNSLGQLGTNDLSPRSSPVQVSSSSWSIVSAGNTHTTAITTDGKLYTWGDNTVGTLGYTIPPQTYYSWTSVAGNADYTVAIRNDGLLFAWGTNNFGQLGDFTTINRSSPVQIGSNSWSVVTANAPTGGGPVLAIRSDGTLWGWGYNATGVLGINDVANRSSPVQVSGGGSWTKVAASKSHTLAIKSDGTLYTWGLGSSGQLGLGINNRSSPVQIGTTGTINSIYFTGGSSNDKLTLASSAAFDLSSGTWTIEFWMYTFSLPGAGNNCRILMFGTNGQSNSFAVSFASDGSIGAGVAFAGTGIASTSGTIVINTWYHFAVVSNSGSANVYVNGVLKAGPITITQPTLGNIGLNIGYDTVATVNYQYTGYLSNIRIIKGQSLFTGAFTPSTSPLTRTTVGHTGSGAAASISGTVSLLTAQSTTIIDNSSNNFTITLTGSPVVTPTVVPFSGQVLTNISYIQVSAGDTSSYAIKNDNQLYTWGAGTDGRLGLTDTVSRSSPVQISSKSWTSVFAYGSSFVHAIDSNNKLFAWGLGTTGQLGYGDIVSRSNPVQISTGNFSTLGAYGTTPNTLGIQTDGSLWGWGSKTNLLLGDFSSASYTYSWSQVSAGPSHTAAIRSDGRLYTWGLNSAGQLGNSSTVNTSSPTLITTILSGDRPNEFWNRVAVNGLRTVAVRNDGTLWTWGSNAGYVLGTGDSINRSKPIQIGNSITTEVTNSNIYSTFFNGNGDYLAINYASGSTIAGDFTWETWAYDTGATTNGTLLGWRSGSAGWSGFIIQRNNSANVIASINNGTTITQTSGTYLSNVWNHVALVRSGTTVTLYVNGTNVGTGTVSGSFNPTASYWIGSDPYNNVSAVQLQGYISNQRFVNGTPVYTSNFTPGTTPLTLITNTGLLTCQNVTFVDNSVNSFTITKTGDPYPGQQFTPFPSYISATRSWTSLSAGTSHTVAINSLGRMYSWGDNTYQQLGQGSTVTTFSSPVQVGTSSWSQVSSYGIHNLALNINSLLYGWGDNTLGQVGVSSSPLQWSTVSSYYTTQMIRNDGIVYAMGLNNSGQIGDSSIVSRSSSVQLSGGGSWSQIVSGYDGTNFGYSIGIKTDGTLYAWGLNSSGILGDSTLATTVTRSSPVQVGTSSWISVSTMNNSAIAIRSDYTMWAWGKNDIGQLGQGDTASRSSPVQIGTSSWTQVSVGVSSAMAIRLDGALFTWGLNANGQLGQIDTFNRNSPVQVGIGNSYIQLSGSSSSKYAIRSDGALFGWGYNVNGQLGLNDTVNRSSPVQVNTEFSFDLISSGADHAVGKRRDGTVWAWGLNTSGQVGDITIVSRSSPVQVGTSSWISVSAGYKNTFGITSSALNGLQNLYAWGYNLNGEFGLGDTAYRSSPVQIGSGLQLQFISSPTQIGTSSWTTISAGLSNSMAIRSDYKLYTWGDNSQLQSGYITPTTILSTSNKTNNDAQSYIRSTDNALIIWGANDVGQLGLNDTANRSTPVQLGVGFGNSRFAKIARAKVASAGYTLGIKTDSTLWSWGSGVGGVLGSTATTNRSSPVQVGTLTNWSDVAAGLSHALAIKTDGSLWGWGLNTSGQAGVLSWSKVSSGSSHTLAIRSDGALYGWGSNTVGQVGDNSVVTRSSPVQLGAGSYIQISAGVNTSAAIRGDNTLYTWGNNANGAIGDGTTTNRSSPVQVSIGNSSWTQVSARDYMMAISSGSKLYTWGINTNGQLGSNNIITRSFPVQVGSSQTGYNSVLFNGTSQYITLPGASTAYTFGTNDFTVEAWIYLTLAPTAAQRFVAGTSTGANGFAFGVQGVASQMYMTTFTVGYGSTGASIPINVWVHLAWIRQSSNIIMFINGNIDYTTTSSTNITETGGGIGSYTGSAPFPGYISNLRVINNQALYTAKFTPSTLPLTKTTVGSTGAGVAGSITGTVTLLACQDITFIDNSNTNNTLTLVATPVVSGEAPFSTGTSVTQISAGTAGLFTWSTGALYGMGLNTTGQIGDGTTISRSAPVQIGSSSWSVVSASNNAHTLALTTNNKLYAWGNNFFSQLGLNDTVNRSSPVQVGSSSWTNVYAGTNYSIALRTDNTVFAWGDNTRGNLGVYNLLSWTIIGNGIGIHSDYTLWNWGDNSVGQLGISSTQYRSSPVQIGSTSWTYTYSTTSNAYAIKSDGSMWAWGRNYFGQLGLSDTTDRSSPVQIGTDTNWSTVVASATGHALAIRTTGTLWAWGYNQYNELGLNEGNPLMRSSPVQVGTSSWTKVSAGNNFTLGILNTGALYSWGRNEYGQTGNPSNIPLSWTTVAGGDSYSVAIRSDGKLFSWGKNDKGQLGLGHTVSKSAPTQIAVSSNYNLYSAFFNGSTDFLSNASTTALTFGTGAYNVEFWMYFTGPSTGGEYDIIEANPSAGSFQVYFQAGSGGLTFGVYAGTSYNICSVANIPQQQWVHVAMSRVSTAASQTRAFLNGVLVNTYTDANNYTGVGLGIGGRNTGTQYFTGYLTNVRLVKGQALYTSAFTPSTTILTTTSQGATAANVSLLTCQNDRFIDNSTNAPVTLSQNGSGISTSTLTPFILTAYNYSFTQISTLTSHTVAIRADGTLWSWGANDSGQLGQGDIVPRSAPLQVGSSSWTNVFAGPNATYAVRTDGGLFTAGDNTYGILGQGDTVSRSSLVQLGTSSWTSISSSLTGHTLGITNTGALYGWGYNQYNELGLNEGNPLMRSSPVQVGSSSWTKVSAGNNFSLAISSNNLLWAWGRNEFGQVPPATGTVLTALSWTTVAGGDSYSVAIRSDGKLFSWGLNNKGQLGLGHTLSRSAPTQIAVSANYNYYSTAFNGTNDSLSISSSILPTTAGTAYTFEGWYYITRAMASGPTKILAGGNTELNIDNVTPGQIRFDLPKGVTNVMSSGTTVLVPNVWYHIAITRTTGNLYTLYLNGVSVGSGTQGTASTSSTSLGAAGQTNQFQGYMYGVRTVTSLLYTGNFIPSITLPTAIANTTLLTCVNDSFTDISGTQTVTVTAGSTGISPSSFVPPLQSTAYNYSWTQVSATLSHVLAVRADGALFSWGDNTSGQLGQSNTTTRSAPIQIGSSSWTKVAAGSNNSFAIRSDGALFGWGDNTNGILGQNNTTSLSSPVIISSGTSWTNISATQHILGTTNLGAMYAWGLNNAGQLGTTNINAAGDTVNRSAPVQLGTSSWNIVSAGTSFSMATLSTGVLFTWGLGTTGQLGGTGGGATTAAATSRSSPSQIGTSSWSAIASGTSWAGGISAFRLFMWGGSANYELGVGTTATRSSPVQLGALSWTAIGGTSNPVGIQAVTGNLFGWGTQTAGQLGQNDVALRSSPVQIASLSGFVFNSQSSPTQIGTSSWTQIQAGTSWSAAILTNGALFTWGFGVNGELASGATTARSSPVQVGALTTWGKLAGTTHVLGTLTTGTSTLVAWGTGNIGQLGNNTITSVSSPVAVSGLLTGLVFDNLSSPTQIGSSSWTQIAAGDIHSMALRIDSGLFTWGKADYGQLGSGNSTHRSSPVQVGSTSWSQISAGNSTSAAITTLGSLQTWGRNNIGQLGSATTTDRNAPAAVGTSSWTSVSASKDGMFAVTILNQLFAWGNNNIGQLGVGDTANRSSPVQVGSNIQTLFSNPTQISASILPNTNSVYFNGTNDYLALASNAAFAFGTGNFTIECWVYSNSIASTQVIFDTRTPDTANIGFDFFFTSSTLRFGTNATTYITGSTTLLSNTWYHVAISRSGTTTYQMFLNGLQEGSTYTTSQNFTNNTVRIGNGVNGFFNGYISNLRVITGQGLYTNTFTPSKTALTNNTVGSTGSGAAGSLSGTVVLLTCQSTTFVDNSTNNFALQVAGMPLLIGASYTQVSAGESNTVLINTTGVLFNTGDATTGQMGDSTTVNKSFLQVIANPTLYDNRSSPAQIGTGSWSQIAVGLNYSVALASNGTLYTWGDNTAGYLGDGTTLTRRSMTQIGTSSYTSISSGGSHTVALKLDKTLYAWGLNNAGQLGDNSVLSRSSPVQVNTGLATSWNFISAGASHTGALDATYNLPYGWGLNSSGQLGDSTVVSRSAPVQVNTASLQNYSYQFNGSNQYLTSAASASNQLTSNFTIEFWFYAIALNGGSGSGLVAINDAVGPNSSTGLSIFLDTGGILTYFVNGNGGGVAGPTIVISTWYHVALVRSGSTNTLYLNGVSRATSSTTPAWSATPSIGIGRVYNDNGSFVHNGYISNVRIVKGTALYTSGFYPSTGSLTTASQGATPSQVLLLTAQSATIVDNSINLTTFTNTGTVASSTSNPFGPYYSGNFTGSNYLNVTNNSSIDLATGAPDWTIECWFYTTTSGIQRCIVQKDGISGSRQSQYNISISTGNQINLTLSTAVGGGGNQNFVGGSISASTWYHVAAVRSGSNITVFLNGAIIAGPTALSTTLGNNTGDLTIGMNTGPADFFTGYISNLRIVKGTAVYTGSFTPPTNILRTAQSAMTNMVALTGTETILLTLQNATVIDNSASPLTITNNNSVGMTTLFAPFSASGVIVYTAWDSIQAGVTSTIGISNNTLYTWGAGTNGQLGDNTVTGKSAPSTTGTASIWSVAEKLFSSPVQVGTAYSWSLVSAGAGHTIAMATDYSLWVWGQNTAGQTGDSTTVGKSNPTQIAGNTSSYTFITAGVSNTFAIRTTTNLLFAWGLNTAGQLGLNDTANRSSPVQVFAGTMTSPLIPIRLNTVFGSSYTVVQAGSAASVIDSLGRLFTWGTNTNGQVADNTTINRSSPVQLGGLTGFTYSFSPIQVGSSSYSQVSAGYSHTLAIGITGSLYAWGKTPANGATVTRSSPVQIGSNSWLFVSAGIDASQAIDSTRTLYAWGLNTNYQLGSASFLLNQSVTSPVAIGTLAINTASHTNSVGSGNGGFIKNI
jgi:alpha-tubulin suppressor-like RCC1 family protein